MSLFFLLVLTLHPVATAGAVPLPEARAAVDDGGDGDGPQSQETIGQQVLERYVAAGQERRLRDLSLNVGFEARMPKMRRTAVLSGTRTIDEKGAITYQVEQSGGDKTVLKEAIVRWINGEQEGSLKQHPELAVNQSNYKFKYKGLLEREQRKIHLFEVTPRRKAVGLFKGELWIDPETFLPLREAGRFVKSPSVFLKRADFVRTYKIVNGFAVPTASMTNSETRLWGRAEVDIVYTNPRWNAAGAVANNNNAAPPEPLR